MSRPSLRRALVAVGVAGLVLTGHPLVARAVPPHNNQKEVLNSVGADVTHNVVTKISADYNANTTKNPDPDKAVSTPALLDAGETFTVPGDSNCGPITYNSANPPPNGASFGISALIADTNGCIDFARSSRDKKTTDPSNLDFYAFAKDAVTWARFDKACAGTDTGPLGCAPQTLTQDQLKGIYLCDQPGGVPKYTNWAQVGGDSGKIIRFFTQLSSGTGSFFETKILGLSSSQQGVLDDSGCAVRPIRIEQSHGNLVPASYKSRAILPYSFGNWVAQKNGVVENVRGGAVLSQINGIAPSVASIGNGTFLGIRYVYNVTKSTSPSLNAVLDLVGVDGTGNGYICAGTENAILKQYGFVTIPFGPAGPGLPNSYCRKNPTPL
jgi:ABC-type phosphate transport system substrate-binding protein